MTDLIKAHENYQEETILKRIQEENERTGESYETIVQTTKLMQETISTQTQIVNDLDTSKRKLFFMKLSQNSELLLFYSGLLFYICVILYILLRRGPISWIIHMISPSLPEENQSLQEDL